MLDLALLTLVFLVASTLWLLLRPPLLAAERRDEADYPPPLEGGEPAESPSYPDAHGPDIRQPDKPDPDR